MKIKALAALTLTMVAGSALVGCSSDSVSMHSVAHNMTPEVMTLNQRPVDVYRHMAYTKNVNERMFWEDLGRVWYTDHPSRLNPIEIVSISGKPH